MSKEKQIEEMARIICKPTSNKGNCDKCGFSEGCSKFDDAIALYNAGYRKQSEWISVAERLPEFDERVLVYLDSKRSYTKIDTDRIIRGRGVRWGNDITHWMPLPEAPKMKGGAE